MKPTVTTSETPQRLVRSVHSRSTGENPFRVMIVGTHKDKILDPSVIDENEGKLLAVFADSKHSDAAPSKLDLVYGDQQNDKVLFQLNTLHPQYDDKRHAQTIRQEIENSAAAVKERVPIRWYVLELMLQQLAKQLKRRVLSKSECLEIARALGFPENVFIAALNFFDRLCTFHYYPDILPEVVFVDSQVLVDMVTKLIEYCFRFRQKTSSGTGLRLQYGDWQSFKYQGVITPEILRNPEFGTHFAERIFTCYDFLVILQKLLVIAPLDPNIGSQAILEETDRFLMPSLLECIKNEELEEHRNFTSVAAPLLVRFSDNRPRAGVFCCLVVYLMKECNWELLDLSDEIKVARNCVKFKLPIKKHFPPCEVTLIDSYYTEVHVEVGETLNICTYLFPSIKECVSEGIKAACSALHYTDIALKHMFFCQCSFDATNIGNTSPEPRNRVYQSIISCLCCSNNAISPIPDTKRFVAAFECGPDLEYYLNCERHDKCPYYLTGKPNDTHKVWLRIMPEGSNTGGYYREKSQTVSSLESTVFQARFDRLVYAVKYSLGDVTVKAFSLELISDETKSHAENLMLSEHNRASKLLDAIHDKIKVNKKHFYEFITILKEIPTLTDMAEELSAELANKHSQ